MNPYLLLIPNKVYYFGEGTSQGPSASQASHLSFKAPENCQIEAKFDTSKLGMLCFGKGNLASCYEWVEIKTKADLSEGGARYESRGLTFFCRMALSGMVGAAYIKQRRAS